MFYSLPLVGVDIQSYQTKPLKIKFEEFIEEFSDKEAIDIKASDIFKNAKSESVSLSDIKSAYRDLVTFCDEEGIAEEPGLLEILSPEYESKHVPHVFWCHIDIAILILHFFERINYENNRDEIPDDSWTPPENWSNGTDDEQEAYQTFWEHKSSKGPK
jgi:hypothetical protein